MISFTIHFQYVNSMKNKINVLRLTQLIFSFIIITIAARAQWQPDVRLTNDPADSYTTENNTWCIAATGNDVHIVWYDNRDGNFEIYYKRSTDGGMTWGGDVRLTTNTSTSERPSVAASGQMVNVVWHDLRDGNYEIYYKNSTDGGLTWGADTRLTNDPALSRYASIALAGLDVHIVWDDYRDGNNEIYYKRSSDGGVTWGTDTRLTNDPALSYYPSVAARGLDVHLAWEDNRDTNFEIYYKSSADGGLNWSSDIRLTNNSSHSAGVSIAVTDSLVHTLWSDTRDGNNEIYYKRSADGGASWGADTRLTNDAAISEFASVTASGSAVHAVWSETRDGNYEIYYKRSNNGGLLWGVDTRLTNNVSSSRLPSVSLSGSVVHVVWEDIRDGNDEIYYKRDSTGNVSGIYDMLNIENQLSVFPNPAKGDLRISNACLGIESVEVFDMFGVKRLTFNTTGEKGAIRGDVSFLPSGIYIVKARKEKKERVGKFVKQ